VISFLQGEVVEKIGDRVTISVGGCGYDVLVPTTTLAALPPVGKTTRIYTRLQVRDDSLVLYGFSTSDARSVFDLLITVNSVGPKVALAFLSVLTPDSLRRAVATGDDAALTIVPGVGKKVATRVVLELKDRLGGGAQEPVGPLAEVRDALLALGLSAQEARDALAVLVPNGDKPVEELLREALKAVGR
jgi:Holliday junction DNA helicase RuvA